MNRFFNRITALVFVLPLIFHTASGQEYINPVKNLSVILLSDTLIFKELVSNKLVFKLPVKKGTASHYLKFSPSGEFLITSGTGPSTNLYKIRKDTAVLAASLPILTEEAIFNGSEKKLFILHSRSLFKTRISSYSTESWEKSANAELPFRAHDLTINAPGTLLALCESTNIRTLHTSNLKKDKVYWQSKGQRLLTFNPAVSDQAASVNKENRIQIRDIKKDTVLMEIKAHRSKIIWLGFDPTGKLLVSLDENGNLFTWIPSTKQCIAELKDVRRMPVFNPNGTLYLAPNGIGEEASFVSYKRTTLRDSLKMRDYFLETGSSSREILTMPGIGYGPETGISIGLELQMFFYPKLEKRQMTFAKPTVLIPMISYGLKNKQVAIGLETHVNAIKGWQLNSDFRYGIHETNYYFGIGKESNRRNKQAYTSNSLRINGNMLKMFGSAFSAGLGFSVQRDNPLDFENAVAPNVDGINGGWTIGLGPVVQLDNRNNSVFPTRGSLFNTSFYKYGLGNAGDYQYNEIKLDYRKYIPSDLLVKGSVFAFQALFEGNWGGAVPFYKLPHITADRSLRGMWRNLYIDRQIMSVQGEFRSFFSPESTRYGYAVFAGVADGATNFFKNYNPDFKIVYGTGLRVQLLPKQRMDLRADVSFNNKGDVGVYSGIGVAF